MPNTREELVDTLLTRGVERVYPDKETVRKALLGEKPLTFFLGIDPTGPNLHIGHGATLLKLRRLQRLGHKIILLIGGFTATIGDPTDKKATRVKLTHEEVLENAANYETQAGKVLDMANVELRNNSDWYVKMSFAEVLELASEFTTAQLLERDMFQERMKAGDPIYFHEMFYPMMQGYDSVAMDVDGELGGNDQTFNMLAGRTMLKKRGKEKFVIAGKLLVDPTGRKMGKSEGNMITLGDASSDMYGKVMSWPDVLLEDGYELFTDLDMDSVRNEIAIDPKLAKMKLAREIVTTFAGTEEGEAAEHDFVQTFQEGGIPEDTKTHMAKEGEALLDILLEEGLVPSKASFRRLVDEGGVRVLDEAGVEIRRVRAPDECLSASLIVRVGKRRFLRIVLR